MAVFSIEGIEYWMHSGESGEDRWNLECYRLDDKEQCLMEISVNEDGSDWEFRTYVVSLPLALVKAVIEEAERRLP